MRGEARTWGDWLVASCLTKPNDATDAIDPAQAMPKRMSRKKVERKSESRTIFKSPQRSNQTNPNPTKRKRWRTGETEYHEWYTAEVVSGERLDVLDFSRVYLHVVQSPQDPNARPGIRATCAKNK